MAQQKCCTPEGQIKRYLNCIGCDRKPDNGITMEQQTAVEWLMKKTDIIFKQLQIDRMQALILLVDFNEAKKKEIDYREKYKYSEKDLVLAIDMARDVSDDGKDYKYSIKEILKHYE